MRRFSLTAMLLLLFVVALTLGGNVSSRAAREDSKAKFSRTTVDMGIVVSDAKKAVDFYSQALGFQEAGGFDVPATLGKEAGLSDNQAFHVHVMVLGDDPSATKIKLMQFAEAPGKKQDSSYIHSTLGMSYLTVWVADIDAAVKRAAQHGAKPLADGPVALPGDLYLACVRDPDGNIIELVGPKP